MAKKVAIGAKPSARRAASADDWVKGSARPEQEAEPKTTKIETTRYTIDIPVELHARIKSKCALKHIKMREEIIMLLEKHFAS